MKIPNSAIFVAGLSIALFFITLLVISFTAHQENAAKPQPTEIKPDPILLEYKPNDKIYLILRGNNENKNASESKIITSDYSLYNGLTTREISYTHWINIDFDPPREAQIKNNKLILTAYEKEFPFLADEFHVEDDKLWHTAVIVFNKSSIKHETLLSLKNKMLKYKHKGNLQELDNMPDDLLILALCGDKEAISLLKDRDAYNKYFNIQLDGAYGEIHSAAAGAYDTFMYLRNQGGSIKEVIPLDK